MNIEIACEHCEMAEECSRRTIYDKIAADLKNDYTWLGECERKGLTFKIGCAKMQDNRPLDLPSFIRGNSRYASV